MDSTAAVEQVARDSYSQLLSFLASRAGGDVAGAEDALSESFLAALKQWPITGVPENPSAWLLTIARRRLIDDQRRGQTRHAAGEDIRYALESAYFAMEHDPTFPDERLALLFVCAHPAIDPAIRTPLMLQTVLGLDAGRIAAAFLVAPVTMSQRLVRAKTKIRDSKIPFVIPRPEEMAGRLDQVLEAIYAAYHAGWEDAMGEDPAQRSELTDEAIWLTRLLVRLLPESAEALGLLALILHCQARRSTRLDENGSYVPLTQQDVDKWNRPMQLEAERWLTLAAGKKCLGRFQLEAAIQSVHAQRFTSGQTHWSAIAQLYDALLHYTPALGARVARAAAICQAGDAFAALLALEEIPDEPMQNHQPYWATRAHVLAELRRPVDARMAYQRAIELCSHAALRDYLTTRCEELTG